MTPIIEVKGLSKKYQIGEQQPYLTLRDSLAGLMKNPFKKIKEGLNKDEFWALKDINFTVEPGEVVGIIGRNGAGKSTLLKILSRITPPTTGEITLRGRVGSLLEVGTGFQQELTGRENIYLNGAILGMTQVEIKRKFDEIVAFAEVDKFIDTPVKHYSSGMYMRLAFSIAAHLDPEILIVDEVLAVGDAEFQKKCLGKMSDLSQSGKTVIFVSHNILSIKRLCNRAILLVDGNVSALGITEEIIDKYQDTIGNGNTYSYSSNNHPEKSVQINSVVIKGDKNKNINTKDSIIIDVKYSVRKKLNALLYVMIIDSQDQIYAFSSENENFPRAQQVLHEYTKGEYTARIKLPPDILLKGTYNFFVKIDNPFFHNYDSSQAITVNLDQKNDPKAVQWVGKIHPIIDINVEWQIRRSSI